MPSRQPKRRIITNEKINGLLILSGAYVLLPFLYVARYDHPSADDYGFAPLFSQYGLGYVWKQQYLEWTGRYLMPVFFRLNPTAAHSLTGYRLFAVGVILLFAATVVFTVRSLLREYLSPRQILGLSALFIGLYFAKTPGIAEAFYWYSSCCIYQLPNIFFLLLLVALARLHRQSRRSQQLRQSPQSRRSPQPPQLRRPPQSRQGKPAPALVAWSALLCIAIIGCNEVSLIMTCLFIGYLALTQYRQAGYGKTREGKTRHRKMQEGHSSPGAPHDKDTRLTNALILLALVCILFAIIEIAAPGNYVRLNAQHKTLGSILWTITGSLSITALYGSQWVAPLLAASVLYIPLFGLPVAKKMAAAQAAQQTATEVAQQAAPGTFDISIRSFAWFMAGSLAFLLLFVLWTANGSDLGRILDVVYFYVIAGYFFLLQLLLNNYLPRLEIIDRHRMRLAALGLALFVASLLDLNNNISTAYIDVVFGKARAYDQALTHRVAIATACKTDTCNVAALPDAPATIFFTDIRPLSDSSGLWVNLTYSRYWHTGFMVPDGPPPVPGPNLETLRNMGKVLRRHIAKK